MFPLNVTEELYYWPEKSVRTRKWVSTREASSSSSLAFVSIKRRRGAVSDRDAHFDLVKQINVAEAMAECKQSWMKEALDRLVKRLSTSNLEEMRSA
ncbi:hypothetical protein GW17_00057061 [Ensete ventricosum]|uniref:Uncharacterized protein n=1 Tax=Ensete ventricosum TaxID=4639 RepID=A0A426XJH4_ENSVE|nr:hypothetical protein B296_00048265 [Ensete ventricosum]RWV81513.1 hypothetical protein GW17_00057061 [Ensete ventricosum]RZS20924.1 hypothetical protein BHM03_00053498 [Ensete ventricosum]